MATRGTAYDRLRILLAIVLLTASALKCYQLATEPIAGTGFLDSRWLLMATVEFELFLGLWLLANILPRQTWTAAACCFALFTCISLYKALFGYASCGCFGSVKVNPWYTTTLDVAIVISLLHWRPRPLPSPFWRGDGGEGSHAISFASVVGVLFLWLSAGIPAGYAMGSYTDTTLSDAGEIIGDGKIVVLEPEKWIGKRFPLLPFVEDCPGRLPANESLLRERLTEGEWLAVLYHHDCPRCREAIPRYKELARRSVDNPMARQVVMIEAPPFDDRDPLPLVSDMRCALGRLSNVKGWFVEGPVEVVCSYGIVKEASVIKGK